MRIDYTILISNMCFRMSLFLLEAACNYMRSIEIIELIKMSNNDHYWNYSYGYQIEIIGSLHNYHL